MYNENFNVEIPKEQLQQLFSSFGGIIFGVLGVIIVIGIVFYVLNSVTIQTLANHDNIPNSWMAWIPLANNYLLGQLAFNDNKKALMFLGLTLLPFFSGLLGALSSVANIASSAFMFYVYYKIYQKRSDKAALMLIFSVLSCGLLLPIFLFAIRNNEVKSKYNDQ